MKIAVNVQTLQREGLEGIGLFTYQTLIRIIEKHPEHEFLLIFSKGIREDFVSFPNVTAINVWPPINRPAVFVFKFECILPSILKKHGVDLFISTDGISGLRIKTRELLVVHDLSFEENEDWSPKSFKNYYRKYMPKMVHKAARIAVVSEYTKMDVHKRYGVPLEKMDIVYNASDESYAPISESDKEKTRAQYSEGLPYFVFVGSQNPRKNPARMFMAFDHFKKDDKDNTKLLLMGNRFYWTKEIKEAYESMRFKDDVLFLGYLHKDELRNVIASSIALVYVSLFEGFGVPPLEAMQCETAVIASNVTSIPEVSGDAAYYVNPLSVSEISEAFLVLSTDKALRQQLIKRGKVQCRRFSWDQAADMLWTSIEKAL